MKLNNTNFVASLTRLEPCLCKDLVRACLRHAISSYVHGAFTLERRRVVGDECLCYYLDGLVLKLVFVHECFGGYDAARSAILYHSC